MGVYLEDLTYKEILPILARTGKLIDTRKIIEIDLVRCGECKYFNLNEWDETICGVPIIVAHEICHKWGDGCKTNIYGFCFMGERRADDNTD